jgi:hypothetical protein
MSIEVFEKGAAVVILKYLSCISYDSSLKNQRTETSHNKAVQIFDIYCIVGSHNELVND